MIDFNELIKPTLEILEESGKSMYIKDYRCKTGTKNEDIRQRPPGET